MLAFSICFIILDIVEDFEYVSDIKYARVLNMLQYSYNSITFIIVTNVIILEFLSAQFVHPDALTTLSF